MEAVYTLLSLIKLLIPLCVWFWKIREILLHFFFPEIESE